MNKLAKRYILISLPLLLFLIVIILFFPKTKAYKFFNHIPSVKEEIIMMVPYDIRVPLIKLMEEFSKNSNTRVMIAFNEKLDNLANKCAIVISSKNLIPQNLPYEKKGTLAVSLAAILNEKALNSFPEGIIKENFSTLFSMFEAVQNKKISLYLKNEILYDHIEEIFINKRKEHFDQLFNKFITIDAEKLNLAENQLFLATSLHDKKDYCAQKSNYGDLYYIYRAEKGKCSNYENKEYMNFGKSLLLIEDKNAEFIKDIIRRINNSELQKLHSNLALNLKISDDYSNLATDLPAILLDYAILEKNIKAEKNRHVYYLSSRFNYIYDINMFNDFDNKQRKILCHKAWKFIQSDEANKILNDYSIKIK